MKHISKGCIATLAAGLLLSTSSWASCNSSSTGYSTGVTAKTAYSAPGLGIAHMLIDWMNDSFGNVPADVMCHFTNDMGMPTSLQLPFDTTKTFGGHQVELNVTVPTESFAVSNGYVAKGVVFVDGAQFMTMWWAGGADSAKGFLIMPPNSVLSPNNAGYIMFDRTNPANQILKVWFTRATTPTNTLGASGDMVMYGRIAFNSTTQAITSQTVMVQNDSGTIDCRRGMVAGGSVLGTSLDFVYNNGGGAITASSSDWSSKSTGLNEVTFTDSTSTTTGSQGSASQSFDYSCADVDNSLTSGLLAGGTTSNAVTVETAFPY